MDVCTGLCRIGGKASEKAARLSESDDGKVPIVCTPTGGAKSVRLSLNENWEEKLSDEELLHAIESGS